MALRLLLPILLISVNSVKAQGLGGLWPIPQPTFSSGETPLFITENIDVTYNGASVRWFTHTHFLPLEEVDTKKTSQAQLTYTAGYVPSGLTSTEIVKAGLFRTFDKIFSQNFVPWMLVPRYQLSNYEPSRNGSTSSINGLDITLTSSDDSSFEPSASAVDESYNLTISEAGTAKLSAHSANGVLHGLETFSQLFYEHSSGTAWYLVNAPIEIEDTPTYPWRGLMLDTARNFFPVSDIKRTIDGMSATKLNKLHIHVTDSQSWPLYVESLPELSEKGAYTQSQVYSPEDIESIQEYGVLRGVDVYFEIDMPGHIGVVGESHPDLVVAYDAQPYTTYCAEPPCGALKLNNSGVEDLLEKLWDDVLPRVNKYTAYFHTGGDEIKYEDYVLDPDLATNETSILKPLIQEFIDTQHTRIRNEGMTPMVWEEIPTPTQLNLTIGKDVVVQSWLGGTAVPELAGNGTKVIDSNYNFWYLDCGRGQWITWNNDLFESGYPFNDWCGPTKSWELVYSHDPRAGVNSTAAKNVLGGEVALWSETIDSTNLDTLAWPRAAAAAEVLWSGRTDASGTNRSQLDAAPRLNSQRQRLVAMGINAAPIQMEWCTMYPNATGCAQPSS